MDRFTHCVSVGADLCERWPLMCVTVCSLAFRLLHRTLGALPRPVSVETDPRILWKWKNLSVSVVHSVITGTWAIASVIRHPEILNDLLSFFNPSSYLLVCFSSGYFLQDAVDILFSGYARRSQEFLLHHALVLWCFLYVVLRRTYVAGVVIALFVEVNSVFLHTRLMLKLAGVANTSYSATIVRPLNFFTYVFFRLGAQFYITHYIVTNYTWLEHALCILIPLVTMNIMMLVYLERLLRADFCPRPNCDDVKSD
ncbi:TLC domain-containing protein 1 [Aplochiton taeniatus]